MTPLERFHEARKINKWQLLGIQANMIENQHVKGRVFGKPAHVTAVMSAAAGERMFPGGARWQAVKKLFRAIKRESKR